ncbi:MAG: hypothetical protein OXU23_08170 [Candidatus Poribacteria bacterium]|nr:hypothetical protein [Candidatus Poribacteria bacterium]
MRHFFKLIFCLLIFLFPIVTYTKPTGEIIFNHPLDFWEVWIGDVQKGYNARRLYRQKLSIYELSVQKNGVYFTTVALRVIDGGRKFTQDAYLWNRERLFASPKNLTRGWYGRVIDVSISRQGDVVFVTAPKEGRGFFARGIYLIPYRELKEAHPRIVLLKGVEAQNVDWSPNGKTVAYSTDKGVYILDVVTRNATRIIEDGTYPVFAPHGKRIAFVTTTIPAKIGVLSLRGPRRLKYLDIVRIAPPRNMTWSPDGQYIAYTEYGRHPTYNNYAMQVANGTTERILEVYAGGVPTFEWTHTDQPFAVEPTNKLTTRWGQLKR